MTRISNICQNGRRRRPGKKVSFAAAVAAVIAAVVSAVVAAIAAVSVRRCCR